MLTVCRSSRLEYLAEELAVSLRTHQPRSVLSPQTIVVGHLGMKRWLQQWLAERVQAGLPRCAGNLQMLLPNEWLELCIAQFRASSEPRPQLTLFGDASAVAAPLAAPAGAAAYRQGALRWRLLPLLAELPADELHAYLHGESSAERPDPGTNQRRFELADRVAGLFGQYLVYRRQGLIDWQAGRPGALGEHWQGELWRRTVAAIGEPPRQPSGAELHRILRRLAPDPEAPMLHVFGVSHLPPEVLSALVALAQVRAVTLYFPDPCRELWEDLVSRRQLLRAELDGKAWLEIGHPLLASLGRRGQHFTLQLNSLDEALERRDPQDELDHGDRAPAAPLLARLQDSIRSLQPERAAMRATSAAAAMDDSSLRVHACHTRLRELEVLRDALLDRLAALPDLEPRQIVVMAPNMAEYAPLLPAVFGEPARSGELLPYHLADLPLRLSHPLLASFAELLDLPSQRISRSEVLALLALPAVMRALELDDGQLRALERWLDRCHVAWSLDGPMKADFGAAPEDMHSFAFALDRMAAGVLLGVEAPDTLLPPAPAQPGAAPILPATPVEGPDAQALGALWTLLALLREWRAASSRQRPLSGWIDQLLNWLSRLYQADSRQPDEHAALLTLRRVIGQLREEADHAGCDPQVDWPVLRAALKQTLDGVPDRQPFLAGGITFCGMVPQRSIPFRVIALLGLNDGEYPRGNAQRSLDLMAARPQLGDRDGRHDDRYLFLEALMSARDALHLSYLGEAVHDGTARNPALPLAELLGFLDAQHGFADAPAGRRRPWLIRHPLQPFDARYFVAADQQEVAGESSADATEPTPDPRLYSFARHYADAAVNAAPGAQGWQFLADTDPLEPAEARTLTCRNDIDLDQLCRFYRRPSGWLCEQTLLLSRRNLELETSTDEEPLIPGLPALDSSALTLVWQALRNGSERISADAPAELARSGRLAPGPIGELGWEVLREKAQILLGRTRALAPFERGHHQPAPQSVALWLSERRLSGQLDHVYHDRAGGLWLVMISQSKTLDFKHLLPWYLQWLCLRLDRPAERSVQAALVHLHAKDGVHVLGRHSIPESQLRASLARLVDAFDQAGTTARHYFPRTSHGYAESALSRRGDPDFRARQLWEGSQNSKGECAYEPGYNALIGGNAAFLTPADPQHTAFAEFATRLYADIATAEHGVRDAA